MKSLQSDLIANIIDLFCYNICIGVAGYRLPLCSREIVVNFSHVHLALCLFACSTKTMAPRRRLPLILGCCLYFDYEIFRFFFSAPFSNSMLFVIWIYGCSCVEFGRPSRTPSAVSLIRYLTLMAFVRSCSDPKVLLLRFLGHFNCWAVPAMVGKVFFLSEINYYNTTLHLSKSYVCF